MQSTLNLDERIQVNGEDFKHGVKIKNWGHITLKSVNNNNDDKRENPWMGCTCDSWCQRESCPSKSSSSNKNLKQIKIIAGRGPNIKKCTWEWFDIYHSSGSGLIKHDSYVHIERNLGCGSNKLSGRDGYYLTMDTDYGGSCETWKIKIVRPYEP